MSVDPFVIQWPKEWMENEEIRPVLQYLNIFLHDLWVQTTGGGSGILAITFGGTGADNAADARTNLGVAYGIDVQAYSPFLDEAITFFTSTDITAAEAETLSDGSNADALHVHTVSAITDGDFYQRYAMMVS